MQLGAGGALREISLKARIFKMVDQIMAENFEHV